MIAFSNRVQSNSLVPITLLILITYLKVSPYSNDTHILYYVLSIVNIVYIQV